MAKAQAKPGATDKGLSISAKREQFYSGGQTIPFGYEPRTIAFSELTDAQVEELRSDPFLIVKDVDIEQAVEPATK